MKAIIPVLITVSIFFFTACSKEKSVEIEGNTPATPATPGTSQPGTTTPVTGNKIAVYEGLVFSALKYDDENQYFSTLDTSFKKPMAKSRLTPAQLANVDIIYFYDYDYDGHGFMDPATAGQHWYWDNKYYYYPWLSGSKKTTFYYIGMTDADFALVKSDPDSKRFDQFFQDTTIAPHGIFPAGSCLGGRMYNKLAKGQVWAFVSANGSKRGLLLIRRDQEQGWPDFPITGFRTKVDIIKEK